MTSPLTDTDVAKKVLEYIRDTFLDGDPKGELRDTTPLLEWGVLDSLKTARLLGFLRTEFGRTVPPLEINADNLRDVKAIAAMVVRLA